MKRFFTGLIGLILNLTLLAAIVFVGGAVYMAYRHSVKQLPATSAQRAYAQNLCVTEQHGSVQRVVVVPPDLFHSSGSAPHLEIRCSFGRQGFMVRTMDIASTSSLPE